MRAAVAVLAGALVACTGAPLRAQSQPAPPPATAVVEATAGPQYAAEASLRMLFGDGHRALWTAPLRVPVLDLDVFAGGLEAIEQGGGRMTRTLHMRGADGRTWIFRTVDKFIEQALPPDLQRTFVHNLFQAHVAALHPTGALLLPPLLRAAGVLHVEPSLYVMPHDARLGEHAATFAGVLGMLELRPDEGTDGAPGFAGSRRVVGTDRLVERIEENPAERVAAREYLAARLIDFLIGDTDRGSDQWRWAGFEQPDGGLLFRPVPRDRDFAFIHTDGLLAAVARNVYPKLVEFEPEYPSLRGLVFSSRHRDSQFLAGLSWAAWDSVVTTLQAALTDDVIDDAIARLPAEHRRLSGPRLRAALSARRAALPEAAARFYASLAGVVDVRATAAADTARVEVLDDGSVDVSLTAGAFRRRFLPGETREVRLYLLDGNDHAEVRGAHGSPITLRIIGGPGDDTLLDATSPGTLRVALHDDEGANTLRGNGRTRIDRVTFRPPDADTAWAARRVARAGYRDFGRGTAYAPVVDLGEGAGLVLGVRATHTERGFRRVPFAHRLWASGAVSLGAGGFAVGLGAERTWENSAWAAAVTAAGSQFDSFRFAGFGNDSPPPPRLDGGSRGRVMQDRLELAPALSYRPGPGVELDFGLRARYLRPRPVPGSPLAVLAAPGAGEFGTMAAWLDATARRDADARVPGYRLRARAALTPDIWDAPGTSLRLAGDAATVLPLGAAQSLALRVGAARVWGDFAVQDAAFIGGRSTLRGYHSHRLAGDAAAHGGVELRSRLFPALLFVRGDIGAFAFADAGRVFLHGRSPGGWHTGVGAGLSFSSLGLTGRVSWAYGEDHRLILELGSALRPGR